MKKAMIAIAVIVFSLIAWSIAGADGHCGCFNNNGTCSMPCSSCCDPGPCKGLPSKCK